MALRALDERNTPAARRWEERVFRLSSPHRKQVVRSIVFALKTFEPEVAVSTFERWWRNEPSHVARALYLQALIELRADLKPAE
jgi:hypothetical protein